MTPAENARLFKLEQQHADCLRMIAELQKRVNNLEDRSSQSISGDAPHS